VGRVGVGKSAVYVVLQNSYDNSWPCLYTSIEGIFSSRKAAEQYADTTPFQKITNQDYREIQEWEVEE
jgi:hypothetical protein